LTQNQNSYSEVNAKASESAEINPHPALLDNIRRAIAEDVGTGDVTTNSIVPADAKAKVQIVAKQSGVIAGLEVARAVFLQFDDQIVFHAHVQDGSVVSQGQIIADISGAVRALLTGERTALNFLGRMSGIATLTRQFVDAVAGTQAVILDTRKTAPGLRASDKLAVQLGGGQNHRHGLFDMVLIKDNHSDFAGSLSEAVSRVRATGTNLKIEVEARSIEEVREALDVKVERILLDNMTNEMMAEAVRLNSGFAKLEASGNVNLSTVRKIAETGVNFISVGALTHSPPTFDVSLKWIKNQD
jgi:nicotinate-nucleotide pyrophosphorylase (carboxylating)